MEHPYPPALEEVLRRLQDEHRAMCFELVMLEQVVASVRERVAQRQARIEMIAAAIRTADHPTP